MTTRSRALLVVLGAALTMAVFAGPSIGEGVIVYFKSSVVELPEPSATVAPEGLVSCESGIYSALIANSVSSISFVVPSFSITDKSMTTSGGLSVGMPDLSQLYLITVPPDRVQSLIDELNASPEVVFAEPNGVGVERSAPNDSRFNLQWALNPSSVASSSADADIGALAAWDITQGDASVAIGILEPGGTVWANHPDLQGRVSGDLVGNVSSHATHVAGIAAATGNNSLGIAGVDWNCGIVSHGFADYGDLADDMYALRNAGVSVINHSWGQGDDTFRASVAMMFAMAYKANILNVVSMPATYSTSIFPNAYNDFGLNVAATNSVAEKASYTVQHSFVDLAAPGGEPGGGLLSVYSTVTSPAGDPYGYQSGTSMAAPHVAGAAALLKAYDSSLYNDDIAGLLRFSARDINAVSAPGFDNELGWGRLDVRAAIALLEPPFSLVRPVATGGGVHSTLPSTYMLFAGLGGWPVDGYYSATPTEVRHSVVFASPYAVPPKVWGRGVETVGFANTNPNFGVGWCEPVVGTVTKFGCVLRTYVFDLETGDATPEHVGYVPASPADVRFAYSIDGIRDLLSPSTTVLSPGGGETLQAGQPATIQWQVADEYLPGVLCDVLLDLDTPAGTIVWQVAIDQPVASDGTGAYNWTVPGGQPGGSTYKVRIIAQDTNSHEGIDVSDEFFTINPWSGKGGPPPPPEPCEYPCAPPAPTAHYTTDLLPASPNPFNPQTRLRFTLKSTDDVALRIYDIHGRLVTTVIEGQHPAGLHEVLWDGRDAAGRQVASGVYFAALKADQRVFTRKLVMLK